MKNMKLGMVTRIILAVISLSLIVVLFTPIWRIDLNAPQYPEGLTLKIYANDIKGNVDIINGLNHYIGMKTLHKADFPEFSILPYCIGFFIAAFIIILLANRKKWLYVGFTLFLLFGIIAMADFWKWEYNYGHNLDPHAAIVVPGMAYQPPLIGFKQLLNFGAYSIPDIGGWIFVGCGALLLLCLIIEILKTKKNKQTLTAATLLITLLSLNSCTPQPEAIKLGADNCYFCKMTISDPRYGAEIVTSTGKIYKFDDIHCMESFIATPEAGRLKTSLYYANFSGKHELIDAAKSYILRSDELKCPMNGHLAAFDNMDSLNKAKGMYGGEQTSLTFK